MDFVTRLKIFIEHSGLQNSQIADMAGIPRPTLSQLLTGRNKKVSNELIEKLHKAFPNLNVLWLLFGDGDMELEPNIKISEPENIDNSLFSKAQYIENEYRYTDESSADDKASVLTQKNESSQIMSINPTENNNSGEIRRVQSIMVFYSDNSFEVFEPARKTSDE